MGPRRAHSAGDREGFCEERKVFAPMGRGGWNVLYDLCLVAQIAPELGRSLEEGKETHFSVLAWRIPQTEEPDGLRTVHQVTQSWTQLKRFSKHAHMIDIYTLY